MGSDSDSASCSTLTTRDYRESVIHSPEASTQKAHWLQARYTCILQISTRALCTLFAVSSAHVHFHSRDERSRCSRGKAGAEANLPLQSGLIRVRIQRSRMDAGAFYHGGMSLSSSCRDDRLYTSPSSTRATTQGSQLPFHTAHDPLLAVNQKLDRMLFLFMEQKESIEKGEDYSHISLLWLL